MPLLVSHVGLMWTHVGLMWTHVDSCGTHVDSSGTHVDSCGAHVGLRPGHPSFFFWATKNHVVDATTRSHTTCSRRRDQAKDLGARLTTPASPRRPSPLRPPHPPQWSADQGRPILLQRDGPTPAQPAVRREPAAHPRRGFRLHTHAQRQAPAGQDSPARRAVPCHEAGESVFQGQVHRVACPCACHHPGHSPQGAQRRQQLRTP